MNYVYIYLSANEVLTTVESLLFYYEALSIEDNIDRDIFPLEASIINKIKTIISTIAYGSTNKTKVLINIIDKFDDTNLLFNLLTSIDEYLQKIEESFEDIMSSDVSISVEYNPISYIEKKESLDILNSMLNYNLIKSIEGQEKHYMIYTICLLNQTYLSDVCSCIDVESDVTKQDLINSIKFDSFIENHEVVIYYSHTSIPILI